MQRQGQTNPNNAKTKMATNTEIEPADIMRYLHEADAFDKLLVHSYLNKVPSSFGLERHGKKLIRVDVVLNLIKSHSKEHVIEFLEELCNEKIDITER